MRESRTFAERTKILKSDEASKNYFFIYEGAETEAIYFDAINFLREDIGINPVIKLVPIIRSYSEDGWSNPKKILDRVIQNLKESKEKIISYETLLNRIMDYFYEVEIITTSRVLARKIWETMKKVCNEELKKTLDDIVEDIEKVCNTLVEAVQKECNIENIVEDISDIIKDGGLIYEEGFDKICLIVDRDKESFSSEQYKYVMDTCEEKGFYLCVTNPCFEFWLLLHFDQVLELDNNKLLENPKVSSKRRYVEDELCKLIRYKKSFYKAEELVKNVDIAIKNQKRFCEDIGEIENCVGSNIGKLIEDMRKDNK